MVLTLFAGVRLIVGTHRVMSCLILCGEAEPQECGDVICLFWRSDKNDLTEETLLKQYELVKRRTSNNYTYNMGSHVLQFGSLSIDEEPVADYLGELNTGARPHFLDTAATFWLSAAW